MLFVVALALALYTNSTPFPIASQDIGTCSTSTRALILLFSAEFCLGVLFVQQGFRVGSSMSFYRVNSFLNFSLFGYALPSVCLGLQLDKSQRHFNSADREFMPACWPAGWQLRGK
jgi:hypothetical protein